MEHHAQHQDCAAVMSRSDNSRKGSGRRNRDDFEREEIEHDRRRVERCELFEVLEELPATTRGDCPSCDWITARETCPMCGEEVETR